MRTPHSLFHLVFLVALAPGASPVIQVSPEPGAFTFEAARDRIRELRAAGTLAGPATIEMSAGTYRLNRPLVFDSRDSNVVIRAVPGETVTLAGSIPIGPRARQVELRQPVFAVHSDTRSLHLARTPNGTSATVSGTLVPYWQDLPEETTREVAYSAGLELPENLDGASVQILPRYNWWNVGIQVKTHDANRRVVTLADDTPFAIRAGDRFYLEGVANFLDTPGEYHHDIGSGVLKIVPYKEDTTHHATVLPSLISVEQGENISFEGITFRHAGRIAVHFRDSRNCTITRCGFRQIGGTGDTAALTVSGGSRCAIADSTFHDLGATGIHLTGSDHTVRSCEISRFGLRFKQGAGIRADGNGHTLAKNHIHRGPRWGIGFHGTGHTIEANRIHHVSLETSDSGAIYTNAGRSFEPRGVIIRNNIIADVPGFTRKPGTTEYGPGLAVGIYLDEGTSGCAVTGNTISRTTAGAILVHGGSANVIAGNTFSDTGDRGAGFDLWESTPEGDPNIFSDNTFLTPQVLVLKLQNVDIRHLLVRENIWGTESPTFLVDGKEVAPASWGSLAESE